MKDLARPFNGKRGKNENQINIEQIFLIVYGMELFKCPNKEKTWQKNIKHFRKK